MVCGKIPQSWNDDFTHFASHSLFACGSSPIWKIRISCCFPSIFFFIHKKICKIQSRIIYNTLREYINVRKWHSPNQCLANRNSLSSALMSACYLICLGAGNIQVGEQQYICTATAVNCDTFPVTGLNQWTGSEFKLRSCKTLSSFLFKFMRSLSLCFCHFRFLAAGNKSNFVCIIRRKKIITINSTCITFLFAQIECECALSVAFTRCER